MPPPNARYGKPVAFYSDKLVAFALLVLGTLAQLATQRFELNETIVEVLLLPRLEYVSNGAVSRCHSPRLLAARPRHLAEDD